MILAHSKIWFTLLRKCHTRERERERGSERETFIIAEYVRTKAVAMKHTPGILISLWQSCYRFSVNKTYTVHMIWLWYMYIWFDSGLWWIKVSQVFDKDCIERDWVNYHRPVVSRYYIPFLFWDSILQVCKLFYSLTCIKQAPEK